MRPRWLLLLPLLAAASAAAQGAGAVLLGEAELAYLWSGGAPLATTRPGGWTEYYFSSDVPGGTLPVGSDTNPCTPAAPCLTTSKLLALAAPGVHFILDSGDAWNTSTTFTATFVLDQAAIGCPAEPDEVCVWLSTTAAASALDPVDWGNPHESPRSCLNVLSDGSDRGWVFIDGFAVTCNAAGDASDGDGPDTNLRGKLWCHNCPVSVVAADGFDNAATAHAGGVLVISGVSPLVVSSEAVGRNPVAVTTAGGTILIVSRQAVAQRQTAGHDGDVVLATCGGQCSPEANRHSPAAVLLGPRVECGSGCSTTTSLLELDPDRVDLVSPTSTAAALVAFTTFDHDRASGTHAVRFDANFANEAIALRGFGNTFLTMDHVFAQIGSQIAPDASLDVEDVGSLAFGATGGAGADGAILHFADPDWRTAVTSFRLADLARDESSGSSQCYLEYGDADVIAPTLAGCEAAVAAVGPSGNWSLDAADAGGAFEHDFPNGIVLPAFVTGERVRGVSFARHVWALLDVSPGSDPNPIEPGSSELVTVAVLDSDALAASEVDATSLGFGPNLAAPADAPNLADVDGDGRLDRVSRYVVAATGIEAGDDDACLRGLLLDGTPFDACDAVATPPPPPPPPSSPPFGCGLGPELALVLGALLEVRRRRPR